MAANNELQAKLFADRIISSLESAKVDLSCGEISTTDELIHCFREFYTLQEAKKYLSNTCGFPPSEASKSFMDLVRMAGPGSQAYMRHSDACEKLRQKEEESNTPSTSGRQ